MSRASQAIATAGTMGCVRAATHINSGSRTAPGTIESDPPESDCVPSTACETKANSPSSARSSDQSPPRGRARHVAMQAVTRGATTETPTKPARSQPGHKWSAGALRSPAAANATEAASAASPQPTAAAAACVKTRKSRLNGPSLNGTRSGSQANMMASAAWARHRIEDASAPRPDASCASSDPMAVPNAIGASCRRPRA